VGRGEGASERMRERARAKQAEFLLTKLVIVYNRNNDYDNYEHDKRL
jgi:hypothetical protein